MASESVTGNAFEIAAWYDNNVVVQALIAAAYERGVAAGRTQAAADIRAWMRGEIQTWPPPDTIDAGVEHAARIAEGNTDAA